MYPTFASPATALTIASMMNDEAVARAERAHNARLARDTRHALNRRAAAGEARAGRTGVRPVTVAGLAAAGFVLGFTVTVAGWVPTGQHGDGQHGPGGKPNRTVQITDNDKAMMALRYP